MHRLLLALLAAGLVPTAAFAHAGHGESGWAAGFAHPFLGWDHLAVMIAIGLWAAQSGRWWIPAVFVSVMTAGAGAALAGVSVPGVEPAILTSTVIVAALAILRPKIALSFALPTVTLFAFFHGFAHGAELPLSSLGGVVAASILLHALGYGIAMLWRAFSRRRSLAS